MTLSVLRAPFPAFMPALALLFLELALQFSITYGCHFVKGTLFSKLELWLPSLVSLTSWGLLLSGALFFIQAKEHISVRQALLLKPLDKRPLLELLIPIGFSAIGGTIVLSEIVNTVGFFFPPSDNLAKIFNAYLSLENPYASFFLFMLVAPFTEELMFRGILLRSFRSHYGKLGGIVMTSALFGMIHLNLYQAIVGFLAGIYLGWITLKTNTLLPALAVHSLFNGLPLLMLLLGWKIPGYNTPPLLGQVSQPLPWFLGGITFLTLGIGMTSYALRKNLITKIKKDSST